MGIIKAFSGALEGTFADQWKEIITVENFDEHVIVAPGVQISTNKGRGSNIKKNKKVNRSIDLSRSLGSFNLFGEDNNAQEENSFECFGQK